MKEHIYSVIANTTKGGVKWRRIIVIACNQKEAKDIAMEEWNRQRGQGHLFRLAASRTNINPTPFNSMWHVTDEKTPGGNWLHYADD